MALHNDVFRQQIWEFFCNDLDSCLLVSKIIQSGKTSPFKGGLNFTALLAIFSVIELASGWWEGKEPTQETVANFIQKYFSKYEPRFSDQVLAKKFYNVFRNGLSHQWSPKAGGVAMDFAHDWLLEIISTNGSESIIALNVPKFYQITKSALTDYEHDLDDKADQRLNFEKRYNCIVESDYKEMRKVREMLSNEK